MEGAPTRRNVEMPLAQKTEPRHPRVRALVKEEVADHELGSVAGERDEAIPIIIGVFVIACL